MQISVTPDVRRELDELERAHGKLTEDLVVEASKAKSSALHRMFLWDKPNEAAAIGREAIARQLIIRVKVVAYEAEEMRVKIGTRKYVGRVGDGYHRIDEVMTRESMRAMLLANAEADFMAARRRHEELTELAAIFAAIDRTFGDDGKKKPRRKPKGK